MEQSMNPNNIQSKQLVVGAAIVLSGIILSGPVAVGLVELLAPQPWWQDATTFIEHYSWIQTLPYVFGFLIAGGFVVLMSGLLRASEEFHRHLGYAALTFTGVSASLIFFNYVLQTAFVPLWLHQSELLVSATTMANPNSLGWALEMYGYGILGVATAFAAPLFNPAGRQGLIRILFMANCIVSLMGAFLVPIGPGWVLTSWGMVLGGLWNLLVAIAMVLIIREFRAKPNR
jgi:hypothetical protein